MRDRISFIKQLLNITSITEVMLFGKAVLIVADTSVELVHCVLGTVLGTFSCINSPIFRGKWCYCPILQMRKPRV